MGNALGLHSSVNTHAEDRDLLNGIVGDIMPTSAPSIEPIPSEPEDPWDWTVKQVIDAVCYHKSPLMAGIDTSELVLTNPQAFEQQLRGNSVRGLAFLKDVDRAALRDDLHMQNLGDRSSVLHLIQILRRKSPKFKNHLHEEAAARSTSAFDNRFASVGREQSLGSPISISPGNHHAAARLHGTLLQHSPIAPTSRAHSWVQERQSPSKASSFGQSLPDERSLTVQVEVPSLESPKPVEPGVTTIPVREPAPADQGYIHDSSDAFDGEKDDGVPPRDPDSTALEIIRNDSCEAVLDLEGIRAPAGETFVVDETGRKRRRLVLGSAKPLSMLITAENLQNDIENTKGISIPNLQQSVDLSTLEATPATSNPHDVSSSTVIEHHDNVESTIISPEALPPVSTSLNQKSDVGVVFVDDKGRKRINPFLISSMEPGGGESVDTQKPSSNVPPNMSTSPGSDPGSTALNKDTNLTSGGRTGQPRSAKDAYLGLNALHIDRIFYGDTPLDQEIQDDFQVDNLPFTDGMVNHSENFTILSKNRFGSGQRTYVNDQLQRFLRSAKPKRFRNNGREVTGIVPYSESLARKHQPISITIYEKSSGGYIASRSNRSAWHNADEESVGDKDDPTIFNFPEVFVQQNDDPLDPDRLEKWKYLQGDDEVLPAYGDSGSDGEYDLDTLREIEREQRKRGRPSARRSRHSDLDDAQVNAVIDRALEQFAEDWQMKRAPKLQRVGWKVWRKSRQQGNTEAWVTKLTAAINHLTNRLRDLRKEILEETWSSEKEVLKQAKSMQETVFDQKHAEWHLSIVKLKTAPEKPAPLPEKLKSKRKEAARRVLKDGEEDFDSDDRDSYDSDEGMDDFIVNDDDHEDPGLDDELMVAEAKAEKDSVLSMTQKSDDHTPMDGTPDAAKDGRGLVKNQLFKSKRTSPPMSKSESAYIDLTQLSDAVEPEISELLLEPESKLSHGIRTPPLDAVNDTDLSFRRFRRQHVEFRRPPIDTEIINLESDTEGSERDGKSSITQVQLPAFDEVTKISQMHAKWLEERQDRKRLLIWTIARCPKELRQSAITEVDRVSYRTMEANVWEGLLSLTDETLKDGRVDIPEFDAYMRIASWFITWTIPVRMDQKRGIQRAHLATAIDDAAGFSPFYSFLKTCLAHYTQPVKDESLSQTSAKGTPAKRVLLEDSTDRSQGTPVKKRKYEVQQSQEAMDLQYKAQQRVRQQERRKKELKHRFKAFSVNDEDSSKVIINLSKEDHHDFIFINPKIGQKIQEHQKDGVRFMWRELTADHEKLQGCLLSHTMGLGKTMQVITLLVTIAEAAKSTNDKVSSQIPPALRKSQTLVLCPPALLENWHEEFLMWAPDPFSENVGAIRNVTAAMKPEERIDEIDRWRDDGGVLLLGYTTFRSMVENPSNTEGRPPINAEKRKNRRLTESDHQRMAQTLLETPNLVVADEAHTFKGLTTAISRTMKRISTTSRVALTGSPLSNNLNEYYAIIEWIAPKYLGDHIHFKAHYVEPIEQGLYKESTDAQYRTSRKIMRALQLNLEPKVHRADNTVLKERLHGKVEFLIKVPLTDLQAQIYRDYVSYMLGTVKAQDATQATMFAWLQDLRVLCNHPKLFEEKLRQRLEAAQTKPRTVGDGTPLNSTDGKKKKKEMAAQAEPADFNEENWDPELPTTVNENLLAIYNAHATPLDSISLSFKMLVLKHILDLAERASDKTLVFSHSLPTLDFIGNVLNSANKSFIRIDGATKTTARQAMVKMFNQTNRTSICLVATRAGGLGLNMYGANRVIILDQHFNPMHEEQAIGRAYRIGQKKTVFVYRLTIGGTFERLLINQAIFKQQLATRVVDKKNILPSAGKGLTQYLFQPEPLEQKEFTDCIGKDELVLDQLLIENEGNIRSITLTETFHEEDTVKLSEEDLKEVHRMREDFELRRRDPTAYYTMLAKRSQVDNAQFLPRHSQLVNVSGAGQVPANVTPTPLGTVIPNNWRLASLAGFNALQTKMCALSSGIRGASDPVQMIGSSSVLPIQDQPSTAFSYRMPTVDFTSTAGRATSDLQPVGYLPTVSQEQLSDYTAFQPNLPQVRTDNIGSGSAQSSEQNLTSEEAGRGNTNHVNSGSNSNVESVPENTTNEQNPGTPNRNVTPTSGKPQKPTTPSKISLGISASTTPGTPSRASSSGPVKSKPATTTLNAPRVLRSSSHAGAPSAREPNQKRSSTPSARACSTSFNSSFDSLNDAFRSGSGSSNHSRQEAR
ncbi:MAG: hypothetical protein Q9195_001153 [Heterodermia aff. obscurata]